MEHILLTAIVFLQQHDAPSKCNISFWVGFFVIPYHQLIALFYIL